MDFLLDYKVKSAGLNDSWKSIPAEVEKLSKGLTEEVYHELCHQMNGQKAEYDGQDDGEYHGSYTSIEDRNFRVFSDSLYRGIYARTLEALALKKEEEEKN